MKYINTIGEFRLSWERVFSLGIFIVIIAAVTAGCASVKSLPRSADEVDFESSVEGKTGWSEYQQFYNFKDTTMDAVYEAAKAGLAHAEFALVRADRLKGVVIGEHGMTLHDWNVVAGIYFREIEDGVRTKVIVEGSKDTGFSGDATGKGWTGEIIEGMRDYLKQTR